MITAHSTLAVQRPPVVGPTQTLASTAIAAGARDGPRPVRAEAGGVAQTSLLQQASRIHELRAKAPSTVGPPCRLLPDVPTAVVRTRVVRIPSARCNAPSATQWMSCRTDGPVRRLPGGRTRARSSGSLARRGREPCPETPAPAGTAADTAAATPPGGLLTPASAHTHRQEDPLSRRFLFLLGSHRSNGNTESLARRTTARRYRAAAAVTSAPSRLGVVGEQPQGRALGQRHGFMDEFELSHHRVPHPHQVAPTAAESVLLPQNQSYRNVCPLPVLRSPMASSDLSRSCRLSNS